MNGYVMNTAKTWLHAMKRAIRPGGQVGLDELYEQYGKKHNIAPGAPFVEWLSSVKIRDRSKWKIVYTPESEAVVEELQVPAEETNMQTEAIVEESLKDVVEEAVAVQEPVVEKTRKAGRPRSTVVPIVASKLEIKDLLNLSFRRAKEVLPEIRDIKMLKYALQEANQMTGKDSLCILLRKQIKDLQLR